MYKTAFRGLKIRRLFARFLSFPFLLALLVLGFIDYLNQSKNIKIIILKIKV